MMITRISIVYSLLLALLIFALPVSAWSQMTDLPEGVSIVVVAEYDTDTPGVEKVQLLKVTFQPGAAWENNTGMNTEL